MLVQSLVKTSSVPNRVFASSSECAALPVQTRIDADEISTYCRSCARSIFVRRSRDAGQPEIVPSRIDNEPVRYEIRDGVVGIALGYEDLNDHDELRHDPVLAVLASKLEAQRSDCAPLAGKSTLNRLELSRAEPTRYHKVLIPTMPSGHTELGVVDLELLNDLFGSIPTRLGVRVPRSARPTSTVSTATPLAHG